MLLSNTYNYSQPYAAIFSDESTRNKMRKHITDINDVISEEDIRNVKTDIVGENYIENFETEENPEVKKDKKSREDGNNSSDIQTSWNILDE